MSDVLVLYFSRTGTTETVARHLARALRADLERVTPIGGYAGAGGWWKGVWQAMRGAAPPVAPPGPAAGVAHRLVVVGAPVWAGRLAPPMRSYLRRLPVRIERVAAFWVSGSGGAYRGMGGEIARLAGKGPAATLSLSEREVARGEAAAKLKAFAQALRAALEQAG